MKKYILSLDAGTTSSRAILFDQRGTQLGLSQYEFTQIFPKEGWVEHDPIEIWNTQLKAAKDVLESCNVKAEQLDSIGITNQRETTLIWDRKTGEPVFNAIVWQDRRTAEICEEITAKGMAGVFTEKQVWS